MATKTKKKQWKLIAGRGKGHCMNWGYDSEIPEETYRQWHDEIVRHIGETVILTGGGGWDTTECTLGSVEYKTFYDGKLGLVAHLTKLNPKYNNGDREFAPWINSYQIWAKI